MKSVTKFIGDQIQTICDKLQKWLKVQVCADIQGCFLKEDKQQKEDQVGELFKT